MLTTVEFDQDSALNWPGSWGSSDLDLRSEDGLVAIATGVDARQAAEAEATRMRRLAEVKAQQLRDFQAREAARVRAYRRLERLHAEAARATGRRQPPPQQQQPQPQPQQLQLQEDWESLRLRCNREAVATRRALVGRSADIIETTPSLVPPSLAPPVAPPPRLLLNGISRDEDLTVSPSATNSASARSRRFVPTDVGGGSVRYAAPPVDPLGAASAAARRQRAAQRSLSALTEREAARRWRRRRELSARARRIKAEGEAARRRLAVAEEEAASASPELVPLRMNGSKPAHDSDGDSSIVSVTELTHTVLTLTDRPKEQQQQQPYRLAFLQSQLRQSDVNDEGEVESEEVDADASLVDAPDDALESQRPLPAASSAESFERWQRWLRHRSAELRLRVPALCMCRPDPWLSAEAAPACAVNCMFRGRPDRLLAGLADYVRSADPKSADWWPAFSADNTSRVDGSAGPLD